MLTEDHGVVPTALLVENRIAVTRIAEAAGQIELALHATEVAGIAGVFVGAGHHAEEKGGHVFDRIEAQTVGFGAVHFPTDRADEVGADVFDVSLAIRRHVGRGVRTEFFGGRRGPELGPGLVDQPAEVDTVAVFVVIVLLGTVEIADEGVFRMGVALVGSEVRIRSLMRDVDEVGEAEVLHLPSVAPAARVVPLAVKAVLRFAEVEVLRHHAGICLFLALAASRCVLVETRDVEGPVVHDVVEIDADAEAVRHFHQVQQLGFGAVARAHRVALVF